MAKAILSIIFAIFATAATAQTYFTLNLGSYHTDRTIPYNEANPGLGIGYQFDGWSIEAGFYENSYHQHTTYGVVSADLFEVEGVRIGAFAGAATGYENPVIDMGHTKYIDKLPTVNGLAPLGGIQINAGYAQIRIMPANNGAVFSAQVRF